MLQINVICNLFNIQYMAKKNLHSLMSGIIGPEHSEPIEKIEVSSSVQSQGSSDEQPKRPGRPKSTGYSDDVRATFIVSAEVLRKLKYIALMESRLQKDIVGDALDRYIQQWEAENCKIKLPKKS